MRFGRWGHALALASTVCLVAAEVRGAESATVVLVADAADPFAARMRAELESMGFDVQVQGDLAGDAPSGVLAVARVVAGPPRRIEVLVVSIDASSRVPSRTAMIDAPAGEDEVTVSVRAAEQLRAFFQPLRPQPVAAAAPAPMPPLPPPPSPPPAAPPVTLPPAPPPPRPSGLFPPGPPGHPTVSMSAAIGVGLAVSTAGKEPVHATTGSALDVLVAARLHLGPHAAVGLVMVAHPSGSEVEADEGGASVTPLLVGADMAGTIELAERRLRLVPSAGVAVLVLFTDGSALAPYEGRADVASAAMPFARLELALPRMLGPVRGSVQGLFGVALPEVGINFAGREVATWGPLYGGGYVGLGLDL